MQIQNANIECKYKMQIKNANIICKYKIANTKCKYKCKYKHIFNTQIKDKYPNTKCHPRYMHSKMPKRPDVTQQEVPNPGLTLPPNKVETKPEK